VTITLRAADGGELRGDWFKAGLATGGTLATDGIVAQAIEIEIAGLAPGKHSLVTYHNGFGESPPPPLEVTITASDERVSLQPSARALENEAAESAYLEFD